MSAIRQLKESLNEAWDTLVDSRQQLYRRAAGAITRFTPGDKGALRDDAGDGRDIALRTAGWGELASEVFDEDDNVVIRLGVPGMDKENFNLQVRDSYLFVRGEKRVERERAAGVYHVTECAYGTFERAIPLPEEVDESKATASYSNGVLRVELPKAASRRRRTIKIDVK